MQLPADYYDQDDSDNVCFLCGNPRYEPLYHVTQFGLDYDFMRCACGLVKQTPMPNEKFFAWFFNSEVFFDAEKTPNNEIWGYRDYFIDEDCRLATSKRRYRKMADVFEKGPRLDVLKIGPATGSFLHVASEAGHRVAGCDMSKRFIAFAKERYNIDIRHGGFEDVDYPDESFDVIIMFSVLENISRPDIFFEKVRRTLRPGGAFIMNFVDMENNVVEALQRDKYFIYRPPITYTFTRTVMTKVLNKYGFGVERTLRDVRVSNLEKVLTLGRWQGAYKLAKALGVERVSFPLWYYPSRIVIARRDDTLLA
ncbi:MAG: class I SAM-dependent methyltransferase [Nitrospinae bacterium]|nr:class I SAM-dependent methyltransferase [Nitrospinota bacterium]